MTTYGEATKGAAVALWCTVITASAIVADAPWLGVGFGAVIFVLYFAIAVMRSPRW